jgi:hypothetical protein
MFVGLLCALRLHIRLVCSVLRMHTRLLCALWMLARLVCAWRMIGALICPLVEDVCWIELCVLKIDGLVCAAQVGCTLDFYVFKG